MNHPTLLGVVLVGGRSSRMGREKAMLPHGDGGTFLSHAIERLRRQCDDVLISGATQAAHDAKTLADPVAHRGPATGIATALKYCQANGFDACFITPVDTPFLTAKELQRLKQHWRATDSTTLAITDRLQPLIGIYPVRLADDIEQLADSEDCSLSGWFRSHDHESVTLGKDVCRNINAPEDLSHGS